MVNYQDIECFLGNDVGFLKESNKYCTKTRTKYENISEAIETCTGDKTCTFIEDTYCDGAGPFNLCEGGPSNSSVGSCVYKKGR